MGSHWDRQAFSKNSPSFPSRNAPLGAMALALENVCSETGMTGMTTWGERKNDAIGMGWLGEASTTNRNP